MTRHTESEAHADGYKTYFGKGEYNDNPYNYETDDDLYTAWEEGFHAACDADWNES